MHNRRVHVCVVSAVLVAGMFSAATLEAQSNPFYGGGRDPDQTSPEQASPERTSPAEGESEVDSAPPANGFFASVRQQFRTWVAGASRSVVAFQRRLNNDLADLMTADRTSGGGSLLAVAGMAFLYGVAHAILPGHRKTVLISYYISEDAPVVHGIVAGFVFAVMHVISATLVVGGVMLTVQVAAGRLVSDVAGTIQFVSSWLIIAIGLFLLGRKVYLSGLSREDRVSRTASRRLGIGDREQMDRHVTVDSVKSIWPVIVSTGIIPCPVTTSVLLFAISLGVAPIGVLAVLSLSVGLGVALSAIAVATIFLKERALFALRAVSGRSWQNAIELAGAASIVLFGVLTLIVSGGAV